MIDIAGETVRLYGFCKDLIVSTISVYFPHEQHNIRKSQHIHCSQNLKYKLITSVHKQVIEQKISIGKKGGVVENNKKLSPQ